MPVRPTPAPSTRALRAPAAFFVALRPFFRGSLSGGQVEGISAKLLKFGDAGAPLAWVAYALATSWHETEHTMLPCAEIGRGAGHPYGLPGRHAGQIPYGRGDVQLTWDRNYELADRELGLGGKLLANFDLALDPKTSARIMVRGMTEGWFTGRRFSDYLPTDGRGVVTGFIRARAIINGQDRAEQIAAVAMTFQDALVAGDWS